MTRHIDQADLFAFVVRVFRRCGLPAVAADAAAEAVCYCDVRGISTHGSGALAGSYVPGLLDGRIDPAARPAVVLDTGTVAVVDGRQGLGSVTMTTAIDLAGGKARQLGVGAVAVRNSSHFGCAGFYTHRLARFGLVGMAMTNSAAHPVSASAAVPAGKVPPFVLDPGTAAEGPGIALLVELLCGPLAGGGGGHFALVMDPAAFGPVDRFARTARDILDGVEPYPGALEARRVAESAVDGVALPDPVAAELCRLAEQLDIPLPDAIGHADALAAR